MTFRGWPVEAIEFFEGLEADNSKTYWQRNKDVYDSMVRAPMEELLAELEPEFGDGRIFRPYRDIRFSADKSPYKTNIGATIGDGYVQLTADGLGAGSGMWEMAPDQLDRYREAVSATRSGGTLVNLVRKTREAGIDVSGHAALKTAPKGYPRITPGSSSSGSRASSRGGSGPPARGWATARPRIGSSSSSEHRSHSTSGSEPTSVPRPCPSDGGRLVARQHHRGREAAWT